MQGFVSELPPEVRSNPDSLGGIPVLLRSCGTQRGAGPESGAAKPGVPGDAQCK